MRVRLLLLVGLVLVLGAVPARAADPILPLAQVKRGLRCTGLSVVQGTTISSFDVEVLDVVTAAASDGGPRILVRVSGPAVDRTGVAEGFSGSPVLCPDGAGGTANAGAISAGIGEYGDRTVLVTPIEAMLGQPVDPPRGARALPGLRERAHPLLGPITFSGVSEPLARRLRAAGRRAGRTVLAVPAGPGRDFPVQELRPGAAVGVAMAGGDIAAGSIGTVTYRDGDRLWAFGHELDALGRRRLLLQDAYVYDVIANPLGGEGSTSYKLATAGHDLGTASNDTVDGVVGRVGPLPPRVPMRVAARDAGSGKRDIVNVRLADESAVDSPAGPALALVGPAAMFQAAVNVLHSAPAREGVSVCARLRLRELRAPLRYCGDYASGGQQGGALEAMASDFASAAGLIAGYAPRALRVRRVDVALSVRRELREAAILDADGPRVARPGRRVRVRLRVQNRRGPRSVITLRVRVPSGLPAGRTVLTLAGAPEPETEQSMAAELAAALTGQVPAPSSGDAPPPSSLAELAAAVRAIGHRDGVTATFGRGRAAVAAGTVLRRAGVRITGRARIALRIAG